MGLPIKLFLQFSVRARRDYFALEAVVDGFSRDSLIPERRRVLRTPPRFCLSRVSAASFLLSPNFVKKLLFFKKIRFLKKMKHFH